MRGTADHIEFRDWRPAGPRLFTRLLFLLSFVIALVLPAAAQPPQPPKPSLDPVAQALQRQGARVQEFVVGPRYIEWSAPSTTSCAQLYDEMVRLMPRTYNYKPDFYDDPRNEALGALGFVYAPIFFGWALTSLDNYFDGRAISSTNMRMNALRYAAAQNDCWVRQ